MKLSRRLSGGLSVALFSLVLILSFQNCNEAGFQTLQMEELGSSGNQFSSIPTYLEISNKVIQTQCLACHSSGVHNFSSYQTLMASNVIVPGNPEASSFFTTMASGQMPIGGARVSAENLKAVADWIAAGASEAGTSPSPAPSPMPNPSPMPAPMPMPSPSPAPVTGLSAVSSMSTSITLAWTLPAGQLTNVDVERSSNQNGPFTIVAMLAGTATTYTNSGLTPGTTYYYRVRVKSSMGDSPYSNVVSAQTQSANPANPNAPSAPAGLMAAATSASQINLTWMDTSNNETGFRIEKGSAAAGPFTLVTTLPAGSTSYSDTGLAPVVTFYYRVIAVGASSNSSPSSVASATTWGTFTWINNNILKPKCLSCHSGTRPPKGYSFETYALTMQSVVAGDTTASPLYTETNSGAMPIGGTKLTATQLSAIRTWINGGAPNN